jgi:hypothetical protein
VKSRLNTILKASSAPVLIAAALAAAPASALTVDIAGASASDKFILNIADDLCTAGTITRYFDWVGSGRTGAVANGGIYQGFICTPTVASGISGSLVVRKNSQGSSFGARPVCDTVAVPQMVIPCTDQDGTVADVQCNVSATDALGTTAGQIVSTVASIGVTDVGPTEVATSGVGGASANCDVQNRVFGQIFGIAASTKLRNALQQAQGLTAGSDTTANMPTISSAQVRSLFIGRVPQWSSFYVGNTPLTAVTSVTPPASAKVTLFRRSNASGTTAAFRLRELGATSGLNACAGATDIAGGSSTAGPFIISTANSTDMITKIANQNLTAGAPGYTPGGVPCSPVNGNTCLATSDWAIGFVSLEENAPSGGVYPNDDAGTGKGVRFLRLDGVTPSALNVANGTYPFWTESSIHWKSATVTTGSELKTFADALVAKAKDPAAYALLQSAHDFGASGQIALGFAQSGGLCTGVDAGSSTCTSYSNSAAALTNNCTGAYLNAGDQSGIQPTGDNLTVPTP